MTATLHQIPVNPPSAAPGFTAGARILTEMGFNAEKVLLIFFRTPEIAYPLAEEMEELAWSDPVTVARQWEASGRR
jgi:hypothetical protein